MTIHPNHLHPLTLITDTATLYPEFNGQWTCDICLNSYDNNHNPYHCSICKFDLCLTCFQPQKHPFHPNHDVYFTNMMAVYPQYQGQWKCDGCNLVRSPSTDKCGYHCFVDQFDLCKRCFIGRKFPVHRHPLKPANARILYGNAPGLWMCDVCCRSGVDLQTEFSLHCDQCEFDICQDCRDARVTIPQHNHPLQIVDAKEVYEGFRGNWKCDVCLVEFQPNDRSINNSDKPYHCAPCEFDVCHSCLLEIARSRIERAGIDLAGPPGSAFSQMYRDGSNSQSRAQVQLSQELIDQNDDQKYENLEDSERCIVCVLRPKNATIVHGQTGHICCCLSCAYTLERRGDPCPICRAPIDRVIRQFTT